jgi:uncharacterized protein (DUF1697 family)
LRYVALLRGINVGGNAVIKMADLSACFAALGYGDVRTYIASGNVFFQTTERPATVESEIERALERRFSLPIRVVVRSSREIATIVDAIPARWIGAAELRVTVGFLLRGTTARSAARLVRPREGIDELVSASGALMWATRMDALTRSGIRLIGTPLYKEITARNLNTTLKLAELLRGAP